MQQLQEGVAVLRVDEKLLTGTMVIWALMLSPGPLHPFPPHTLSQGLLK